MPFRGIVNAEAGHIAALQSLFVQRGWKAPENTAADYVVKVGTLNEAYQVGVEAEESNIAMYDRLLSRSDLPSDFRSVFTNLRNASVCHRNAFARREVR
jgi:hypothetical protein